MTDLAQAVDELAAALPRAMDEPGELRKFIEGFN